MSESPVPRLRRRVSEPRKKGTPATLVCVVLIALLLAAVGHRLRRRSVIAAGVTAPGNQKRSPPSTTTELAPPAIAIAKWGGAWQPLPEAARAACMSWSSVLTPLT